MNFGSIFKQLFGTGQDGQQPQQAGGSAMADALARSFYESNQGGATDGSNLMDMARMWQSGQGAAPAPAAAQPATAGQQGVSPSTMQLIAPPQAANINITGPQGSKAKNYVPANMAMTVPGPSALANLGLLPQRAPAFQITAPQGSKAKNYRPAQMVMNAPSAVGIDGMMQVLAMMNPQSPFGTNGRG